MKLNTLLLASAATVMATSVAFAADLPSKKAAPAAGSVQICKVGAFTGFTLPGSSTCLALSGRVVADIAGHTDEDYGHNVLGPDGGASARIQLDAVSNSEIGVIGGTWRFTSAMETDRANIQIGNLTVGLIDSIADIGNAPGNAFGEGFGAGTTNGVNYKIASGNVTFTIGAEDGTDIAAVTRPDILASLGYKMGDVSLNLTGVSAEDIDGDTGYAILGTIDAKVSPTVNLFAFGGMSQNATFYTWSGNLAGGVAFVAGAEDQNATGDVEGSTFGGGATFALSSATSVTAQGRYAERSHGLDGDHNNTSYGLYVSHTLAKNLTIQPEIVWNDDNVDGTSSQYYIRIERDF